MKTLRFVSFLAVLFLLAPALFAQPAAPLRVAVIAETPAAANLADLLTAQLSANDKVQLLERDQILKVYREQGLSAGMGDTIKMGRLLGADGLVLLSATVSMSRGFGPVPPKATTMLTARLVAVKPGAVLLAESFSIDDSELSEWPSQFAPRLDVLLPKLGVLEKDAIPISIVNLRSAVQSDEGRASEREVKALAIQRLTKERQFFVLERQRMELLTEEKDLKSDHSAFWNGSYLLEGVLDEKGYSKDTITLSARLTPPNGGAPVPFEVSGARTNLADVVNQMALKVADALKVSPSVKSWNAADEAKQYLAEANWALRWDVKGEAQMASEAAWALGKHDLEAAMVRMNACLAAIPKVVPAGVLHGMNWKIIPEVHLDTRPPANECAPAIYALQCYEQFAKSSPEGVPKVGVQVARNGQPDLDWYRAGIDVLTASSAVLQHFHHHPDAQESVADQLVELRALARSVADLISKAPTVHDSYFVGDRLVTSDELHGLDETPNIFRCEVDWGCYWSETPDETIARYRNLMTSPVFCYLHANLWKRPPERPRLIAWKFADRQRIPVLWNEFVGELKNSPDIKLQLEADAFAVADAPASQKRAAAVTNFFDKLLANREALITNRADICYMGWHAGALAEGGLQDLYFHKYYQELDLMHQQYWRDTVEGSKRADRRTGPKGLERFAQQKKFLTNNTPFDPPTFFHLFLDTIGDITKAQALELQPLLAAYQTNLQEQIKQNQKWARNGVMVVGQIEDRIKKIIDMDENAQASAAPPLARTPLAPRAVGTGAGDGRRASASASDNPVTNIQTIDAFFSIPYAGLYGDKVTSATITAHNWVEDKLLLDFEYQANFNRFDTNSKKMKPVAEEFPAVAVFDLATKSWLVAPLRWEQLFSRNHFYHRTTLWRGKLIHCDDGKIASYDIDTKQWTPYPISDGNNYELFAANGQLCAADENTIFEITDDGKQTKLLASKRRQPPASPLDTEDFREPVVFAGPEHSLRIATEGKIFNGTGSDFHPEIADLSGQTPPLIFPDGVLFVGLRNDHPKSLYRLATESKEADLLGQQDVRAIRRPVIGHMMGGPAAKPTPPPSGPEAKWTLPGETFANAARTVRNGDLFVMRDHCQFNQVYDPRLKTYIRHVETKDGCHSEILCYSGESKQPRSVFLKFDSPEGRPVVTAGGNPIWMGFSKDLLVIGPESPMYLLNGRNSVFAPSANVIKTGIWLMPIPQLETALAAASKNQTGSGPAAGVIK